MKNKDSAPTPNPGAARKSRWEIASYVFAILASIATIVFPLFFSKTETPALQNDASFTGDISGDSASLSTAAAGGDGSSATSMTVNGHDNYLIYGDMAAASGEFPLTPQDLNSNTDRFSYAADLISQGEYRIASRFLSEFLRLENLDAQTEASIRYNKGICNLCMENYHQAVTDLEEAATLSENPAAYYNLGLAYMGLGNDEDAGKAFDIAVSLAEVPGNTVSDGERQQYRTAKEHMDQLP